MASTTLSIPQPPPTTNYHLKITNQTSLSYTFTVKIPNQPSPTPLQTSSQSPPLEICSLAPSTSKLLDLEIRSDSQDAHAFLILVTSDGFNDGEGLLPLDHDVLVNFWKDTGGLRGDYAFVNLLPGSRGGSIVNAAWEVGFSWQGWMGAKQLAPGEVRVGSGEGGRMLYVDK
ncbi:uncharacterized protein PAC_16177 [Phialocephala subalpina]|uniref:Uncharacterized protein n=1 Tax=Phialocephala subalpina TaxID=576137 RepID=A0A1L7XMX3_9HELO|nr:uncharacterized protein PAC_16177 [Phialocephala subalpina]